VSLVVTDASLGSVAVEVKVLVARAFESADEGTRCWIIVLFTAYLCLGWPPGGDDSEIRERSIVFCERAVSS
jgi:hypothetical protein